VGDDVLVIREGPFSQWAGVMAVGAVHVKELAAGYLVLRRVAVRIASEQLEAERGRRLRKVHWRAVASDGREPAE
jgi:hypothetical protein